MELAVDELKQSFNRVGDIENFSKYKTFIMDLKVWLSASITYQESCLDAFENTTSSTDAGEDMKTLLKTSMRLSSNGLHGLQIFSALTDLNNPDPSRRHRRLLSFDALPILGHGDLELPSGMKLESENSSQSHCSSSQG
ncbi:putative pectinesterase/pectinesterase inhibitor 28 [Prunus yedoensis var. nudiflora]|uniref:Putative pectinesterase/pectinesterase inhibitor 28 n=1 Tax=Prunus yedoensis var. nudiflora TaxID=2094558 RepID=A0A314ZDW8_PRUYE|nr:putative pectinesterase/pectinesterase inhibitor 28 [Prunus yedoensis var. nudiflora]